MAENPASREQSPRAQSLNRALSYITGDRNASYGPPTQDFERTAALWTAFGFRFVVHPGADPQPIAPHHIANAMILLKQSRLAWQPGKADSWDDTSGYSACGHECVVAEQQAPKEIPGELRSTNPRPGDVVFHQHDNSDLIYYLPEEDIPGVWTRHNEMNPHRHEDGQVIPL